MSEEQDKTTIVNERYVAIPREEILGWLVEQGVCIVEINLNDHEGVIFIEGGRIKKKILEKWAKFKIDDELIIKPH